MYILPDRLEPAKQSLLIIPQFSTIASRENMPEADPPAVCFLTGAVCAEVKRYLRNPSAPAATTVRYTLALQDAPPSAEHGALGDEWSTKGVGIL